MKILFDTSVLVAALTARHVDHPASSQWLESVLAGEEEGMLATHALSELYGVITGHPAWKIPPHACLQVLHGNFSTFRVVSLDQDDYWRAIRRMVDLDLPGGGIYDALHAQAALAADAEVILTLNARHFTRLGEDVAALVQLP